MAMPKLGGKAPAFTLLNQNANQVKLSDFAGKKNVVLYFYPKALTPGCTTQACGIRDTQKDLESLDAVVFGVSPDPVDKLTKFIDKHDLNFDLLSDEEHKIADKYGVWGLKKFMGREFMGILRTTFIIDKSGKVCHIIDKVKTKSHHDEVLDNLRKIFC